MDGSEYNLPEHSSSLFALRAINSFKQRINQDISTRRSRQSLIMANAALFSAAEIVCSSSQRATKTGLEYN
ncbi:hypothetical protein MT390_01410 [Vibrio sp. 2-Bac 85]